MIPGAYVVTAVHARPHLTLSTRLLIPALVLAIARSWRREVMS